ncbi:MAG TPA: hypothetical protein GX715_11895 [Armatimonadetes bacterium]|jgi:hypothetical protein|nr:hypothetical protein [Armatimonadota bacterium]
MFQIGVFWEEGFPSADTSPLALNGIRRALDGFEVRVVGYTDLERLPGVDLLILPFGSAFPALGWPLLQVYLHSGGNLLNLGGAPFCVPCAREHVVWKRQTRQSSYHRAVGIRHYHVVDPSRIASLEVPPEEPLLAGVRDPVHARSIFAPVPSPVGAGATGGSDGAARLLRPLLYGMDASGRPVAAPIFALDHIGGPFHGGRWVFAALDGAISLGVIRRLAFYAAQGASDLAVSASFPCYYPGEVPRLQVHASLFGNVPGIQEASVTVIAPDGKRATCELPPIGFPDRPAYRWSECAAPLFDQAPAPGLHVIEASLTSKELREYAAQLRLPAAARADARHHRSGFYVWDPRQASGEPALALGRDYLRREGLSGPVIGAVHSSPQGVASGLTSDPYRWDRELHLMREAGIRVVRANLRAIWAWAGLNCPPVEESLLRAVDAFVAAARAHGLLVILAPLEAEGDTPDDAGDLVDPRRLDAERDILAAFVARYRHVLGIIWEIDETPYPLPTWGEATADRLGHARVNAAWRGWIAARDPMELRAQWRLTTEQPLGLTVPEEVLWAQSNDSLDLKELDYRLFAREIETRWLREMREAIRTHGSVSALTAVGPAAEAPSPIPSLPSPPATVDIGITPTLRTDEDLLCEAVLAKAAGRAFLTAMAGGHLTENPGGDLRTTEEAVRDRVERMLALALATGSAGVLHYPWAPGRLGEAGHFAGWVRADGTATPALDVVAEMAAFLERNRQRMEEPLPSPVAMVVPSSRLLSSPEQAALAIRRCIRTLVYRNAMPLRAIGEYSLRELESAQLMLLPSPRVLQQDAWETLLSRVEAGACLLVTGPFDRDRYWRRQDRLTAFDLHVRTQPVAREEVLSLYGDPVRLHFGETKTEWVDKAVIEGYPPQVMALKHGRGRLLFSPLPLELADDVEPLAELYEAAIAESGIERPFEVEPHPSGVLAIPLCFESVVLYALVSQIDAACRVTLRHGPERVAIPVDVPAERALLLLVDRATGKVLDRYTPAGA